MNGMINYLTTKNRLLVAILAFILPFSFARAEAKKDGKTISQGWYVGIEGGMPFGFSTFSSFGHDKTHLGWAVGQMKMISNNWRKEYEKDISIHHAGCRYNSNGVMHK